MRTKLTSTPALSIGDLIWQAFFSPAEGLSSAARQQPIGWAIAFIVVIPFVSTLVWWTPQTAYQSPWKAASIAVVIAPLVFLVSSAMLHWISWFFGGRGSYPELFSALAFAFIPPELFQFLLINLAKPMGDLGEVLKMLGDIGTFIWGLVLSVLAVREAHGLSTLQAIGVEVTCVVVVVGLVLLWALTPVLALLGILLTVIILALWFSAPSRR
ncbi:MAG: YIP1 family protein [Candidatus Bipolaricaulota bacterium]|nr:YIP1 family protein [Candidatus Bipolaricaulota bacterium]